MSFSCTPLYNHQDNYGPWGHFDKTEFDAEGLAHEDLIIPTWEPVTEPGSLNAVIEMNRLDTDITKIAVDLMHSNGVVNTHHHEIKDMKQTITNLDLSLNTQIQDLRNTILTQTAFITELAATIKKQGEEISALRSASSSPLKKKQKIFAPKPVTYASILKTPQRINMPALAL